MTSQSPQTSGAVARHQLQQIAVHTYDAQLAVGAPQPLPVEVALDGVDEFLSTCVRNDESPGRTSPRPSTSTPPRAAPGASRLSADGARTARLPAPGTCRRPWTRTRPTPPPGARPMSWSSSCYDRIPIELPEARRRPTSLRPAQRLGPGGVGRDDSPPRTPRRMPLINDLQKHLLDPLAQPGQHVLAHGLPGRPVQEPGARVGPPVRRGGEHVAVVQSPVQLLQHAHHVRVPVHPAADRCSRTPPCARRPAPACRRSRAAHHRGEHRGPLGSSARSRLAAFDPSPYRPSPYRASAASRFGGTCASRTRPSWNAPISSTRSSDRANAVPVVRVGGRRSRSSSENRNGAAGSNW